MPQQPALWRRLTVRENLRLVAQLAGHDGIEEVLAANALAEIADRRVAELSIGQAQRANVAAGLIGEPDVLLLDEPTAALDPRQRRLVWELVAACRPGAAPWCSRRRTSRRCPSTPTAWWRWRAARWPSRAREAELRARVASTPDERFEDVFARFLDGDGG